MMTTDSGPELVTNASNFVRGYDPLHRLAGGRKTKVFKNCTFADVAKEIAEGAGTGARSVGMSRPVFGLRSKRGKLLLETSRRIRWPAPK